MYTTNPQSGNVRRKREADICWEGDSQDAIRAFPESVRKHLGMDLRRVQKGESPLDSKPAPGIGSGVYELRDQDARAWYRVLYLKRIGDVVYVLHCFEKKTNRIERADVETAKTRLTAVQQRLREEAKHAKRKARDAR